jgi:hypothetical protein|tara:strand:+ start:4287 stop:6005 length:1719 start_codon:yes stop_codon:yes gene_type:complete
MASKKILIEVILDDKNVAGKSDQLAKSVDSVAKAQQKYLDALKPSNVEIEKYRILTTQANIAAQSQAVAQLNAAAATGEVRAQSGLNNAILLETGRLASDASYGFNGMANNISQLVSLFQSFARTNGGVVKSLKTLLQSLWGVGGVLIAVQLLISFLPNLERMFKKNAKAIDEETEALKRSNEQFKENINLRQKNAKTAKDFINVFTADFKGILKSIEYDSSKTEAKLYEISEAFMKLGIDRSKMLKDENITQGDRVRIAVKLIEIYNKETLAIEIRQKIQEVAARKQTDNTKLYTSKLIKQLTDTRNAIFNINKDIDSLMVEAVIVEPFREKVKKVADLTKIEFEQLFLYLKDKGKDLDFYLTKLLEGWTLKQIEASLVASEALKGAGDAGVKSLAVLVSSDDKFTKNKKDNSKVLQKLNDEERKNRNQQLREIAGNLSSAASLFGENTSANKSMKIASAVINTYAGANEALAGPVPLNFINAAAVIAAGIANVKKIKSVKVPNSGGSTSTPSAQTVEAPDFNVVGQSVGSQLAGVVSNQFGGALRAYVVSGDISSAQELDRKINTTATIG